MEEDQPDRSSRTRNSIILLGLIVLLGFLVYTQVTLFVVQPIGAAPEGVTLVILRGGQLKFIDSADAVCERGMGGVSLLCRGLVLGTVAENNPVLLRLPYSATLYSISTGGKQYEL